MRHTFFHFRSLVVALSAALLATPAAGAAPAKQFRGVWVRPEASESSIVLQLDNMKKAGFNAVYVETFYHGHTIYPSKYVPIRPEMKGMDCLAFYIKAARKRGIQVHPWIEAFYWEVDVTKYPKFPKTTLFDNHPEWKARLRDGSSTEKAEPAHIFASPAHPGVQKLLLDYLQEILVNYDVDGINLDYIRWPGGPPDAGYEENSVNEFMKLTGLDAKKIVFDKENADWKKWVEYREGKVTDFVGKVKEMKDRVKKGAVLSAAVFAGAPDLRYFDARFQNWRMMLAKGYLDAIAPMVYDESLDGVEKGVKNIQTEIPPKSKTILLPILAIQRKTLDEFSGSKHPPIAAQVKILAKLGLSGFSVFCYEWVIDSAEGLDLFKMP
ncbi:MAG: family 10 glycosylhydrolase [bacterium]